MKRLLATIGAIALIAGCRAQEQNPFGAFGPATIPPPDIQVPAGGSYYPAPGASVPAVSVPRAGTPITPTLPSISVPTGGAPTPQPQVPRPYSFGSLAPPTRTNLGGGASSNSFTTEPADREPIRVVEANPSARRPAASFPSREQPAPGVVEAAPAAREPIRAFGNGPSSPPSAAPTFGQPPVGGTRSSGSFRADPSVAPAAYQAVPAFRELPTADNGQWRAR